MLVAIFFLFFKTIDQKDYQKITNTNSDHVIKYFMDIIVLGNSNVSKI